MHCSLRTCLGGEKRGVAWRRAVSLRAHAVWARWAAAALGERYGAALAADPALTSQAPLRNWAETVVKQVRARACADLLEGCPPPSGVGDGLQWHGMNRRQLWLWDAPHALVKVWSCYSVTIDFLQANRFVLITSVQDMLGFPIVFPRCRCRGSH